MTDVLLVDAFTRQPGTGNPAAVVPEASVLADGSATRVRVGGQAVTVLTGRVHLR